MPTEEKTFDINLDTLLKRTQDVPFVITHSPASFLANLVPKTPFIHLSSDIPYKLEAVRFESQIPASHRHSLLKKAKDSRVISLAPCELDSPAFIDLLRERAFSLMVVDDASSISPKSYNYCPRLRMAIRQFKDIFPDTRFLLISRAARYETLLSVGQIMGQPLTVVEDKREPILSHRVIGIKQEERCAVLCKDLLQKVESGEKIIILVSSTQEASVLGSFIQSQISLRSGIYFRSCKLSRRITLLDEFVEDKLKILIAVDHPPLDQEASLVVFYSPMISLECYINGTSMVRSGGECRIITAPGDIEKSFFRMQEEKITFGTISKTFESLLLIEKRNRINGFESRGFAPFEIFPDHTQWTIDFTLDILNRHRFLSPIPSASSHGFCSNTKDGELETPVGTFLEFQGNPKLLSELCGKELYECLVTLGRLQNQGSLPTKDEFCVALNLPGTRRSTHALATHYFWLEEKLVELIEDGQKWFPANTFLKKVNSIKPPEMPRFYPDDLLNVLSDWEIENLALINRRQRHVEIQTVPPPMELRNGLKKRRDISLNLISFFYKKIGEDKNKKEVPVLFSASEILKCAENEDGKSISQALFFLARHRWIYFIRGIDFFAPTYYPFYTPGYEQFLTTKARLRKSIQKKLLLSKDEWQDILHYRSQDIHFLYHYLNLEDSKRRDFIKDYLTLGDRSLHGRHFPNTDARRLFLPATQQDQKIILDGLSEAQREIVRHEGSPLLVLAGPGSGKTHSLVHRAAYLLKFVRILPERLLVLAYNRNAIREFQERLERLVGEISKRVMILTFHQLALKLTGKSFSDYSLQQNGDVFHQILSDALALLQEEPGEPSEQVGIRESLTKIDAILVDEYQDVDLLQYQLLRSISGLREEEGEKVTELEITVVGDDDQNIYSFRGTNVKYIRDFQKEYDAKVLALRENFRSTWHIIEVSSHLISYNQDRSKKDRRYSMMINAERAGQNQGGRLAAHDRYGGKVAVLNVSDPDTQGYCIAFTVFKMKNLFQDLKFGDFAVFGRSREMLVTVQGILEGKGIKTQLLQRDVYIPVSKRLPFYQTARLLQQYSKKRVESVAVFLANEYRREGINTDQETISYILDIARDYDRENGGEILLALDDFLGILYQVTEIPDPVIDKEKVVISSMHGAKGLEFPVVFILSDWEKYSHDNIEEERRLYYVSMTRAKEKLYLFRNKESHGRCFPDEVMNHTSVVEIKYTLLPDPSELYQIIHMCSLKDLFPSCRETRMSQERIYALEESEPLRIRFLSAIRAAFTTDEGELIGLFSQNFSQFLYEVSKGKEENIQCKVGYVEAFYEGKEMWWFVRPAVLYPKYFS